MSKLEQLINELCPEGVEYKALGELGEFYSGLSGKSKDDFNNGNAKFITYMNVFSNLSLKIDVDDKVKIGENENQNTIQYGDVLFTGSSETPEECGMSSVLTSITYEKLYLNSFCFGFRFYDKKLMLPEFSKYIFRSSEIRKQIKRTASGVTRFNVSKKKMEKVIIPIPSLSVQEEIVRILDKFTKLTSELTSELTARKQQYEYYRDTLLTSGNNIKLVPLGNVGRVAMCKRIMKNQTTSTGNIPFYKIGTFGKKPDAFISSELFNEYKEKYSFPTTGSILISASGTIGRTVVYDGKSAYYQDSNIVWLEHDESTVLNKYLYYCYQLKPWNISDSGTISRLYNDNILKAKIPVPYPEDKEKSLAEQQRIVDILDRFDKLCNDISEGLPAEIEARQKQYEYYRDKLLTFKKKEVSRNE